MTELEYDPLTGVHFDRITGPVTEPSGVVDSNRALGLIADATCEHCGAPFMGHHWRGGAPCPDPARDTFFRCSHPNNWMPWARIALGTERHGGLHEAITRGFQLNAKVCDDYD